MLLHFGAVDQEVKVWLNGKTVGEHTGGYLPFSFDITEHICVGQNYIRAEVRDRLDTDLAYGKQRYKRGGMWYTPISGIWQPVWLESVPCNYIRSLRLTPDTDSITVETTGGETNKTLVITTPEGNISHSYEGDRTIVSIKSPVLWTPENPYLYNFTLTDGVDKIDSYFALRTVTVRNNYICLNGKPYFFHGLLDQGYFSDGIYIPATPSGYIHDIQTAKKLGFNMLRKHIKIEPDLFYYYCDKYGIIVFQDMVNSGKYNFLIDTALPTAGLKRGISHFASERRRKHFENDCRETVAHLYNHPCVVYYTIFNEGWGQYDADRIYSELKMLDPTRIWDATSGWFTEKKSDVTSKHIYFRKISLKEDKNRPLVLSEFGGYSCVIEGHCFNPQNNYGYKTFVNTENLTRGLENLYRNQIIPAIGGGLCAAVLTQLSDVEDETNGLVTYDRQVIKTDADRMMSVANDIKTEFNKKTR